MTEWIEAMHKMHRLEELSVIGNPFNEEFTNYKSDLFESVRTLMLLDGERRREVLKDKPQIAKEEDQDLEIITRQWKTEGQQAKRLVEVNELVSVFNLLLHSVEMINYDRTHALDQMHELSNFIDEFVGFYKDPPTPIRRGNFIRSKALIVSFIQNVQLIVDQITEIRSPILYNLCKLAIVKEDHFGEKCLDLLNDFMQVGSTLQLMTKELIINQLIPQVDDQLFEVYQPVLEGLVKMVETDPDLADSLSPYLGRFKEWVELISEKVLRNQEINNSLCNSAIRLIGVILKGNQHNVEQFLDKGIPGSISELLSRTKQHGGNKEREISLLVVIQNCCNTVPTSAKDFLKADLVTKITKPILQIYRERKKLMGKDPQEEELDVEHYVKHIDAFSALLNDQETISRMMNSKISPVPNLISVLYFCREDALVITTICNMAVKIISNKAFLHKLDYVQDFLEWMNNAVNLLSYVKGPPYQDLCRREGITDTAFVSLNDPKLQNLFIAIVNLLGIISEKSNQGIDPFEKASMALNDNQRENLLFSCLQIPSDEVKLAVVRCLYNVKIEEFDKEEINTMVDLIKTYKNVGAGQTEKVLSYIFYIFGKLTYALIKKNIQIFEENKIQNAFFDCLDIIYRNQRRNVENQIEQAEERATLSISCVYFMQSASRVMNIAWRPTEEAASLFVKVLQAEERYQSQHYPQAIQIEQTWMGKHLRFLLKALTDSLTPFTRVSLRIIQRIADLLQNKPQRRLRDPLDDPDFHKKLFDDILRSERSRHAKEYMTWMSWIPGSKKISGTGLTGELPKILHDSEAFVQWTQQHRTFVDYGIELILMFLEGKIKRKKNQFSQQASQDVQEALAEPFSVTVERYVKECEAEEAQRVEQMEKKDKSSNDFERKVKRVQIAPSELVRQEMRLMRLPQSKIEGQMFANRQVNLNGDKSQEYVLSIAAMLRCFYVALEKAPIPETRETTVHLLQQYYILKSLISLCRKTGWVQGYIGVKFIKVVSHLLLPSTESGLNTFKMLNILDQVSSAMREILTKVDVILAKERQNQDYERSLEIKNFFFDVLMIGWILTKEATSFKYSEVKIKKEDCEAHRTLRKPQFKVIEFVLTKMFGIQQLKTFLNVILIDEDEPSSTNQSFLSKRNREFGAADAESTYSTHQSSERTESIKTELGRFYVTQIIGEYLDKCPSYKFQILDILMKAQIFQGRKIRKSYIQEILSSQKRARFKQSISTFLHKPKLSLFYDHYIREKIHCCFFADIAGVNSNQFVKRIVVLSNLGIYIMKQPKGETCPLEGYAEFCRSSPTLTVSFNYEEIDEIIQFPHLPYQLMFKLKPANQTGKGKSKSNQNTPAFYLMRFDLLFAQQEMLAVLKNLSIFSSFDYYDDEVLLEAIKHKIGTTFESSYYVSYNPQSGFGLFNFLKDPLLIKNCQLAVINSDYIFIFTIDWEKWLYLGFRQTMNQQNDTRVHEPEEDMNQENKEQMAAQETRTAWEISIQKRKQKSIQQTLKLKTKILLQNSKLFLQTTTQALLRIESGTGQHFMKFGCDFGRQQFQSDVKRAMSLPSTPLI